MMVFFAIVMLVGLVYINDSLLGVSADSAVLSAILELGIIFVVIKCYGEYRVITKTQKLENMIVSLVNNKKIKRIEVYSDKVVFDGVRIINISSYGYNKPLTESEIRNCVCRTNHLLGGRYYVNEIGKYYGPIDSGRYETEIIDPLYGKPYAVTQKVIYDGGFVVDGYALDSEMRNSKSSIQKKWEKDNLYSKFILAALLTTGIFISCLVITIINKDDRNNADNVINSEEVMLESPKPSEVPDIEILKSVTNNSMAGRLSERGQEDWYEYVAPVSGEYTFTLSISDEDCQYKVTIYESNDEKIKTISTEYDGISKVTLEEGGRYKIFVRQSFAVNLSDAPIEYLIDISYPQNNTNVLETEADSLVQKPITDKEFNDESFGTAINDRMAGRLSERGQEDWYEYVAPVSGEYTFTLSISDEDCQYKVTIYESNDVKIKTISTEYDGISKVTLEEGRKYKIFVRQSFAVNLSDAPCDYEIDISY